MRSCSKIFRPTGVGRRGEEGLSRKRRFSTIELRFERSSNKGIPRDVTRRYGINATTWRNHRCRFTFMEGSIWIIEQRPPLDDVLGWLSRMDGACSNDRFRKRLSSLCYCHHLSLSSLFPSLLLSIDGSQ